MANVMTPDQQRRKEAVKGVVFPVQGDPNDELIEYARARVKEIQSRFPTKPETSGDAYWIDTLADALAARVPVQGEPNGDREALAVLIQRFEEYDNPDYLLADFLLVKGLGFSRATVPDAATEQAKQELAACLDLRAYWRDQSVKARAERDAALAAVERVRAEVRSATLGLNEPIDDWNEALDYLAKKVLAALDGAPEPEWDYCFAEIHDDGEIYTNGPDEGFQFATAEDARAARIEESDVVMKRVKGVQAGPWLPVDGESKP